MRFMFHGQRIEIYVPARAALEAEARQRFSKGQGFTLATVNLDHLVKMAASPRFLEAYAEQDLVVADGIPLPGCHDWRASRLN